MVTFPFSLVACAHIPLNFIGFTLKKFESWRTLAFLSTVHMLRYSTWFWPLHSKLEVVDVTLDQTLEWQCAIPLWLTRVANSNSVFKFSPALFNFLVTFYLAYQNYLWGLSVFPFMVSWFGNMSLSLCSITHQPSLDRVYINLLCGTSHLSIFLQVET